MEDFRNQTGGPTAGQFEATGGVLQARPDTPDVVVGIEVFDQLPKGSRWDTRVGIEQQNVTSAAVRQRQVVAPRKPQILRVADQFGLGNSVAIMSALPSCESLSTTMTCQLSARGSLYTDARQSRVRSRVFQLRIQIDSSATSSLVT